MVAAFLIGIVVGGIGRADEFDALSARVAAAHPKSTPRNGTLTITTPDLGPDQAPNQHAFVFKISGADAVPEK